MPTVQEIHTLWPVARVLASQAIADGNLYGKPTNELLALQIELIGYAVDYQYNLENIGGGNIPSTELTLTSNYLWAWCKQYGLIALGILNAGGIIPTPSSPTIYSIPIQGIYTATVDGESVLDLGLPTGSIVVWAEKSILPIGPSDWSWTAPTLNLLNGISLSAGEMVNYLYVTVIT